MPTKGASYYSKKVRMVDADHWEVALYHLVRRIPSVKLFLPLPSLQESSAGKFGKDKCQAKKCGSEKIGGLEEGPTIEEMMVHLKQQAVL